MRRGLCRLYPVLFPPHRGARLQPSRVAAYRRRSSPGLPSTLTALPPGSTPPRTTTRPSPSPPDAACGFRSAARPASQGGPTKCKWLGQTLPPGGASRSGQGRASRTQAAVGSEPARAARSHAARRPRSSRFPDAAVDLSAGGPVDPRPLWRRLPRGPRLEAAAGAQLEPAATGRQGARTQRASDSRMETQDLARHKKKPKNKAVRSFSSMKAD